MKKYAIIIVCMVFCINLIACSIPDKIYDNKYSSSDEYTEEAGKIYSTVDALAADLTNNQNVVQNNNNTHFSEEIYCLDVDIPDYKLLAIEVMDYNVIYYYVPNDFHHDNFDHETGILVYYKRNVESISGEQLINVVVEQLNLDSMSDGYFYSSERNMILFSVGDTYMYMEVPDNLNNYDILKELCVARKVTIGNQPTDSLESE